ncbi:MAG: hypothetical protein VXZ82_15100 [Planctomycetota bacterium]|nr:hypothetical protein [Planctomycetota bacterium]
MNHLERWYRRLSLRSLLTIVTLIVFGSADQHCWAQAPPILPPVVALEFSPSRNEVLCCSQVGVHIYSWPELKLLRTIESKFPNLHDLQFSPSGSQLAVAGGAPAETGGIELFSWPEGHSTALIEAHEDVAMQLCWVNNTSVISASLDYGIAELDVVSGEIRRRLEGHSRGVVTLCYLPLKDLLASSGLDQSIRVWNWADGKVLRSLTNHKQAVRKLALRPGAAPLPMIASASIDKTIRLWQPSIGRLVRFARLPSKPLDICWNKAGTRIFAACEDGVVYPIDPDTVEILQQESKRAFSDWAYSLALHPDGSLAVGGRDGRVVRQQFSSQQE